MAALFLASCFKMDQVGKARGEISAAARGQKATITIINHASEVLSVAAGLDAGQRAWLRVCEGQIMSDKSVGEVRPVLFGERLAASQNFSQLFRDGMKLVEETAAYLDGPGRHESKKLDRSAALGYATESMRLTTRLMQLASWLLLHRAVNEGEMSLAQASKERAKVKLAPDDRPEDAGIVLPERLSILIMRSKKLQDEVRRLDATIHAPIPEARSNSNPLERQLGILRAAFERSAEQP
jgi:regulator of CtrA degradation